MVIVNTLLTSVMAKLAKFERHVSLSDYTSTVTAKLAIAQFLNTALIVIIVNAGYTGGGLGFLQVGVLRVRNDNGGRFAAKRRSWSRVPAVNGKVFFFWCDSSCATVCLTEWIYIAQVFWVLTYRSLRDLLCILWRRAGLPREQHR